MQLVIIKLYIDYVDSKSTLWPLRVLFVRSQDLSGFASGTETTPIRWRDWLHLIKSMWVVGLGPNARTYLLPSHLVWVHKWPTTRDPPLHVYDPSLESKRREGYSGTIRKLNKQLVPCLTISTLSTLHLSTSNIVFEPIDISNAVSSASLGTLFAPSGLYVTHPRH